MKTMINGARVGLGALVLLALAAFGADASGQERGQQGNAARRAAAVAANAAVDPTLELARTKYAPDQWARGERRDGFVLADLSLPGLTGDAVEFRENDVARTWSDATGTPRVLVELALGERIAAAHEALLRHVAYVQSAKTLATLASRGIAAGDVGYVAYGGVDGSKIAWAAFVVGNLEFRVVNLDPDAAGATDLKPLVELLSARAMAQPALKAGVLMSRPQVTAFSSDRAALPAGESALLDLVASDPTGAAASFDFAISGPGQGYVEQDEQLRWRFHATGAGKTTLTVRALGRNGTVATKTLELVIAAS